MIDSVKHKDEYMNDRIENGIAEKRLLSQTQKENLNLCTNIS